MLAANGCADAFWVGNLKNKNLKGQEIVATPECSDEDEEDARSEESEKSSSDNEQEEEEDDDVTVLNEDAVMVQMSEDDSRSVEY